PRLSLHDHPHGYGGRADRQAGIHVGAHLRFSRRRNRNDAVRLYLSDPASPHCLSPRHSGWPRHLPVPAPLPDERPHPPREITLVGAGILPASPGFQPEFAPTETQGEKIAAFRLTGRKPHWFDHSGWQGNLLRLSNWCWKENPAIGVRQRSLRARKKSARFHS